MIVHYPSFSNRVLCSRNASDGRPGWLDKKEGPTSFQSRPSTTAGTHAKVRYRCFLPDLAGFTAPRCPDHKISLRRGWDSNPRYPFRYTRVPGVRLQPLGHLSLRLPYDLHGERRIRTYDTVAGMPDFESGAFDHSASSPTFRILFYTPSFLRRLLKNDFKISLHSSARTPPSTSTR